MYMRVASTRKDETTMNGTNMTGITMNKYQQLAYTAVQSHANNRDEIIHWVVGLTEEAGEVASLVKHKYFHKENIPNSKMAEELGDVLWYLAALCTALGISLQDVATINISKLLERFPDGHYSDERVQHRHDMDNVVEEFAKSLVD